MKRQLFILVFLPVLFVSAVQAQVSVEATSGIATEVTGSLQLALGGNWTNNGTLTPGNSAILLNGSGLQTITNANGAFNNLTIDKAGGDAQAAGNFTVDGTMTLISGDVVLNGKVITLGANALLSEAPGQTVKGESGYLETTRELNAPNALNVAGMGLEITSSANLGSTVIQRGHAPLGGNGNESILRYFNVVPTNNTALNATLVFHYDESELIGQDEGDLALYISDDNGGTWSTNGGTVDGSANTITLSSIESFERLTTSQQPLAAPPIPLEFVFVADNAIEIDRNELSAGDIQSNYASIQFQRGAPGQHTGNLFAGQDIVIDKQNTIIGDARAGNAISLAGGSSITGSQSSHTPVDAVFLPSPLFYAGGPDQTVSMNGSLTLPPGTYGDVTVDDGGKLNLSAGEYYMNTLEVKASAAISLDVSAGEVGVNVVSMLHFARQASVEVSGGSAEQARFATLQSEAMHIEQEATILGTLIAPKAGVFFERGSAFTGALYAAAIGLSHNVTFQPHGSGTLLSQSSEASGATSPELNVAASPAGAESVPEVFALNAAYPNPFNPVTTIGFDLPEAVQVSLVVYDMLGREVARLVEGSMEAGRHTVRFEAADLSSGMYLYRLEAGAFSEVRRMLLVK